MIRIITLDKHGQPAVIENIETLTLPGDVILMNPGLPPLHSLDFDQWLAAWRTRPHVILSLNKPDTAHQAAPEWRPYQ